MIQQIERIYDENMVKLLWKSVFEKMAAWKMSYGREIMLWLGIVLVGVICFEAGILRGASYRSEPLVIEHPSAPNSNHSRDGLDENVASSALQVKEASVNDVSNTNKEASKNCVFVGSKNSDKYHLPTCSFAKRIKPENIVCFSSAEDAQAKGYKAGCVK